jgi:hypothetical protein
MIRTKKVKIIKISLIVLISLILLIGIYFGYKSYVTWRGERNMYIFEQGFNYGYTEAVLQVINLSDTCEKFPVYAGNTTRELISVTCFE